MGNFNDEIIDNNAYVFYEKFPICNIHIQTVAVSVWKYQQSITSKTKFLNDVFHYMTA